MHTEELVAIGLQREKQKKNNITSTNDNIQMGKNNLHLQK